MKNIKTHIIKFSAIAMGMIYMLMPIHKEIKSVLHSLSHSIEMPANVITHHNYDDLKYKFKDSRVSEHQHNIIDLLDAFLDANSHQKDSKKSRTVNIEIDKHFHSPIYIELKLGPAEELLANDAYIEIVKDPFFWKFKVPPRTT